MSFDPLPGLAVVALLLSGCLDPAASGPPPQASPGPENPIMLQPSQTVPPQLLTPEQSDRMAYEQALGANSNAALIFFLARNPASPHAAAARQALAARSRPDAPGVAAEVAGADAGVVEAFDVARLGGTNAGWKAFLARHGSHPLAIEARFWMPE